MALRSFVLAASSLGASLLVLCQCSLDGLSGGPVADGGDALVDGSVATDGGNVTDAHPLEDVAVPTDASVSADGADNCSVQSDHRLVCANTVGAVLYAMPTYSSARVDTLSSSPSPFDCWGVGEQHLGGNTTWYRTHGDHNVQGWVAGVDLKTSDAFDADPSAGGLPQCM